MTTTIEELGDMIKEKEKELIAMKKEYRERRTEGLRVAIEQRKEAEKLVREEMKSLGYLSRDNDNYNGTIRWYNF
jgi:hypothetical protein|tara:strand:+ start:6931 stop:7155 length:225 start_codon:yes stop_codon:yes gene_type:complete